MRDAAKALNPDCHPVSSDDVSMFKEKHKFIHAVFDKTLKTDRGKKLAREQEVDYNAQSVHQKLN